jgi:hypothetical protein
MQNHLRRNLQVCASSRCIVLYSAHQHLRFFFQFSNQSMECLGCTVILPRDTSQTQCTRMKRLMDSVQWLMTTLAKYLPCRSYKWRKNVCCVSSLISSTAAGAATRCRQHCFGRASRGSPPRSRNGLVVLFSAPMCPVEGACSGLGLDHHRLGSWIFGRMQAAWRQRGMSASAPHFPAHYLAAELSSFLRL